MKNSPLKTILLVVEESASLAGEIHELEEFGYEVLTTAGRTTAVELVVKNPRVGAVLVDLDLRGEFDGAQTARDLLAQRNLPVIFLTVNPDRKAYERALQIPHYGLIGKNAGSFTFLSIVEAAFQLFEEHRLHLQCEMRFKELNAAINRQTQELALLDQARIAVVRDLDLAAVIRNTVDSIAQTFGYPMVSLYLLQGDMLVLQHQMGYENVFKEIPITKGVLGKVVRTGQPVLLKDVHQDPDFLEAIPNVVSEVCVPIFDGKTVVGAFNIECGEEMELKEQDLHLLAALGDHISIAIGHAHLYAKITDSSRFLTLLNDITHAALQASDVADMMQTVADRMGELLGADGCYLTLWDDTRQKAIPTSAYGPLREEYPTIQVDPGDITMTESVLRNATPIAVENLSSSPYISQKIVAKFPARSMLGLPLIADRRKLGAALISYNQPHRFTQDEIARGIQAADQVALAIAKSQLAVTDHMTQAYNRRGLFEIGRREIERARRYQNALSAIMLDVDHFKQINDHFSHTAGDQVLIAIVERIRSNIRTADVLGRYGGEEFTVLLPDCVLEAAIHTAERLCRCINEAPIHTEQGDISTTVSIGVASIVDLNYDLEALINQADDAMYAAKRAGRNCVAV
jgi:diguanylate cyclase (GGDEF)-like protein